MSTIGSERTAYVLSNTSNSTAQWLFNEYETELTRLAYRQTRSKASIDIQDLVHVGLIGLLEAYSEYDEEQNPNFWLYAHARVSGAMLDSLREARYFGRRIGLRYHLEEYKEELHGTHCHIDEVDFGEETTWVSATRCLEHRNRQIVALHFIRGLALHRVGTLFDITESRVAQICTASLKKLRGKVQ